MRSRIKRGAKALIAVVPIVVATGGANRAPIELGTIRLLYAGRVRTRSRSRTSGSGLTPRV